MGAVAAAAVVPARGGAEGWWGAELRDSTDDPVLPIKYIQLVTCGNMQEQKYLKLELIYKVRVKPLCVLKV